MTAYRTKRDGEWVYPVMTGYKLACCDCGSVHRIDFEISEDGSGVRFRATRDNRSTAALRREDRKRKARKI